MITALYHVAGSETEARRRAECICLDQTIEAEEGLLSQERRRQIVGRIEEFRILSTHCCEATITYSHTLIGPHCSDLLNVLFGTSSLRTGVRLISFALSPTLLARWHGPRFGLQGIRHGCAAGSRALVCAVLKPLGRSPQQLADLAVQFVLGGADLIKDDQGLVDQPFCPFAERVSRCAEAIAKAAEDRGRPCLYFTHISGPLDVMRQRAASARHAGATGLLVAPGLIGFDSLAALARDDTWNVPIASHPSLLGTYTSSPETGIAPAVMYGQLPRLAGADISIFPGFETGYAMSREDYLATANACRTPWDMLPPIGPTAAGRITIDRLPQLSGLLGSDVVYILGSRIQQDPAGTRHATSQFMAAIETRTPQP